MSEHDQPIAPNLLELLREPATAARISAHSAASGLSSFTRISVNDDNFGGGGG